MFIQSPMKRSCLRRANLCVVVALLQKSDNQFKYQAFYCEENAWWLLQHPQVVDSSFQHDGVERRATLLSKMQAHRSFADSYGRWVLWISNANKSCALWGQRLAQSCNEPVIWDYHVVVLTSGPDGMYVWDLDSSLSFPLPAHIWVSESFRNDIEPRFVPQVRVVNAKTYRAYFSSDRRHMLDMNQQWVAAPPPWPLIQAPNGNTHSLSWFSNVNDNRVGVVASVERFRYAVELGEQDSLWCHTGVRIRRQL